MKISYVIPCYCSEKTLGTVVEEIQQKMKELRESDYEIILVNDASGDRTFSVIEELCERADNIIGIDLSRNFGQHGALMAGFGIAQGEIVICLDDDGQTPANEVDRLLDKIEEGYDVVYAEYTNKQHSAFRNWGSRLNKRMTEYMLEKPKELYVSSYFAMKRFVVEEIIKYEYAYPYVIGLVLRTTRNICNVKVNHRSRLSGESGYTLKKLINLWVNGFTAFSVKPLRIATLGGAITAVVGLLYTIWTVIKKFIYPNAAPYGWSSIISVLLILGGAILLVLGMIGEYVGRIYISINNSPQYVVRRIVGKRDEHGKGTVNS